jgi:hypothetical protein
MAAWRKSDAIVFQGGEHCPPSLPANHQITRRRAFGGDILGARRKLLFVEGEEHSLDKPIYSLLFPSASVLAKQTCRDVEHAVAGIRDAAELHWLKAFGIVDNDNRDAAEMVKLKDRGVYSVPAVSIESILLSSILATTSL